MRTTLLSMLLMALAAPAVAAPTVEPAAAMRQAATVYAREMQGVIAYLVRTESRLQAPVVNRDVRSVMWVVLKDGTPTRAKVLRLFRDGKPNEAERRKLEERTNANFRAGKSLMAAPYDAGYQDDYTFSAASSVGCAPGERAIAFTSAKQDEQHGVGTLVLTPDGHVKRVRFTPNALPEHVKAGEVVLERGPVLPPAGQLPGLWSNRTLSMDYQGNVGPVSGGFKLRQRLEGYKRFSSVDAAVAAAPTLP
jgi:hypothetical protein